MQACRELATLEQQILTNASPKEQAFYNYIRGTPIFPPGETSRSEIETVCFAAFCKDGPTAHGVIDTVRREKPIMGIHYTKNIVDLFAVALLRPEEERENSLKHCVEGGWKELLAFREIFSDLPAQVGDARDNTDKLAKDIITGNIVSEFPAEFCEALKTANDVLDLFVLHQYISAVMNTHPLVSAEREIIDLSESISRFLRCYEERKAKLFRWIFIFVAAIVGIVAMVVAVQYWPTIEPLLAAGGIIFGVFFLIFAALTGAALDRVQLLKKIESWVVQRSFKRLGLDKNGLEKRIQSIRQAIARNGSPPGDSEGK